jgi:hypothetical protein
MTDYADYINCGFCGDRVHYAAKHDCWALSKTQNQERLQPICPICFEKIYVQHWRCEGTEPTTHGVIG